MDAVVSDIPFGVKHSTIDGVRQLLPKLVPSLHRYVLLFDIAYSEREHSA